MTRCHRQNYFVKLLLGFIVCMMGFCLSAAATETYLWKRVSIGGGGFITGYSTDKRGITRVARADVYGAYIWLDKEDRWAQLVTTANFPEKYRDQAGLNAGVYEAVVAPGDPDRIYLAMKGQVFHSENRGKTFSDGLLPAKLDFDANSPFRLYGRFMAVSPEDPDLVFLGTPENGLLRSTDGARTWQVVDSVPRAGEIRADRYRGTRAPGHVVFFTPSRGGKSDIWVASPGNGVFVSNDDGLSFRPLPNGAGPAPKLIQQGAFASDGTFYGVDSETKKVWRYSQGSWNDLTKKSGLKPLDFVTVTINPETGHIFVFDDGGRPYISEDGGENWWRIPFDAKVGAGDPPWLRVSNISYFTTGQVLFDPVKANRMWIASGIGVFYADLDNDSMSVNWISQTRGIEELVSNDIYQAPGEAPLFAVWDFGIHRKENLDTFSETYGPRERVIISAQRITGTPADSKFAVTNASDMRDCCSEDGDAVMAGYSLDNGVTWTKFPTLPVPPDYRSEKRLEKLPQNWAMSFGDMAVSATDTKNIIWVPSRNRMPFVTKDLGRTWQEIHFEGEKTSHNGSHPDRHMPRKIVTADGLEGGVFYLYHSGNPQNANLMGLWRSGDGGETWQRVFTGQIAPESQYAVKLRSVPKKAGHLFFTTGVANPHDALRRSLDGGRTWTVLDRVTQVDDVAFGKAAPGSDYPAIYVSGRVDGKYGVWRSTDDAVSWQQLVDFPLGTLDQVSIVGADPDVFGRVYLGYIGSSFIYGEPKDCETGPFSIDKVTDCHLVK